MVVRIDFHLHTIADKHKDTEFTYSESWLREYIQKCDMDAIAITNHNLFDKDQFESITSTGNLPENLEIYPGMELSLLTGHVLVVYDNQEKYIRELTAASENISQQNLGESQGISVNDFINIFPSWQKAILVFDLNKSKRMPIPEELTSGLNLAGVSNQQQFQVQLNKDDLLPALFSDAHVSEDEPDDRRNNIDFLMTKGTFLDEESAEWSKIIRAFKNRDKISSNPDLLNSVIELGNNGKPVRVSTGLNLIVGRRGSGKTHFIKQIKNELGNNELVNDESDIFYQEQFNVQENRKSYLESQQNQQSEKVFQEWSNKYTTEWEVIVSEVIHGNEVEKVDEWLSKLKDYASKKNNKSAASKILLLSDQPFHVTDNEILQRQLNQLRTMIQTEELWKVLDSDTKMTFEKAYNTLRSHLSMKQQEMIVKQYVNDLVSDVQSMISQYTGSPKLPTINLTSVYDQKLLFEKTDIFMESILKEDILDTKKVSTYNIVVKKRPFRNAKELKEKIGTPSAVKERLFDDYKNGHFVTFLKTLGNAPEYKKEYKDEILSRLILQLEVRLETQEGIVASGGQEVAFALMLGLENAKRYDIALIDEPEGSLDNYFIKTQLVPKLRELSKYTTTFVITHNSTLGTLLRPNYLVVAKLNKNNGFDILSGKFDDKKIMNISTQQSFLYNEDFIDAMEAGLATYHEKGEVYDSLGN
ncbi:hypothetical protein QUE93_09755 [Leuconostoc falkenbergense]|uniref:Histidinol-phosphatase n=1 Tax=Leuconostoc falkenbergense TaxID=2766470 RepID=A0ABT7S146_9LACO|nr:hypothetical protein [Leuconostoc falkenbergense]MDM7647299.1 hypothetical protein [Leuconostoc falkenbergense]